MGQGFRARGQVSMQILLPGASGLIGLALVSRRSKIRHRGVGLLRKVVITGLVLVSRVRPTVGLGSCRRHLVIAHFRVRWWRYLNSNFR